MVVARCCSEGILVPSTGIDPDPTLIRPSGRSGRQTRCCSAGAHGVASHEPDDEREAAVGGRRSACRLAAALAASAAIVVSTATPVRADSRPRVLTVLTGSVLSVAFDGTRVAALVQHFPNPTFTLELVDLSTGRTVTTAPMPARAGPSLLALAGTTALVNVLTGLGNSEVSGFWSIVPASGGRVQVVRRYHPFHEGACCAVIAGQGAVGQGTVLGYVIKHQLYRVDGDRSVKVLAGIGHLWAVNKRRLLIQHDDGRLAVISPAGALLRGLAPSEATDSIAFAGALQGDTAVVMRRSKLDAFSFSFLLDVYRASTGALLHSWKLSETVQQPAIELYGGFAVCRDESGRATVIRLADGRRARLPIASNTVSVHLGRDGLAFTAGAGKGRVAIDLLPTARLATLAIAGEPAPA